ncbi:MAG: MFS transporter [Clostridia bacterium]|nr:MFS transporter [Clostridia bacterium]
MQENWKKNIILFLVSQTISLFGSSLVQYAITWYITLKTQSGFMMTIAIICGFLPTFFLSPFAGVLADRYNRKAIIILSDALIAISTLILAIVFLMGYNSMWLLFLTLAIRALGAGIQTPAVGAVLPQIVPEDKLTRVNAINSSVQSLVFIAAPMLSAALLTMTTLEIVFFIDVITAIIAILTLILFVKVPSHEKALEKEEVTYYTDLKEGIKYINSNKFVKNFLMFYAVFMFLIVPSSFLTPLQVTRNFGEDIWRLSAIEIIFAVGMIIGGVIMTAWGGLNNRIHTMALASFAVAVCTILLGVVPIFWLYIAVMGVFGILIPIFNTPSTVLIQEKIDSNYLGRVFGVFGMISSSIMPLGMLIFGPLADMVKIEWLLIGTGILIFIISFFLIYNKTLVEAGNPKVQTDE